MRKIKFVKEKFVNDELKEIIVSFTDDIGRGLAIYSPICIPKYVSKFMEKHEKALFTGEYEKEKFGVVEYIYRKEK